MDRIVLMAGAIVAIGAALVVIVRGVLWLSRGIRLVADFLSDWNGEEARPGHDRRPGVPERLEKIEDRVQMIEGQMQPNGGATMRDVMDRVESKVTEVGR